MKHSFKFAFSEWMLLKGLMILRIFSNCLVYYTWYLILILSTYNTLIKYYNILRNYVLEIQKNSYPSKIRKIEISYNLIILLLIALCY